MDATAELIAPQSGESVSVEDHKQVSEAFRDSVYVYARKIRPQWQLAAFVGLSPEHFSRLINGRVPLRPADEARLLHAAELMGLDPAECFE